MTEDGVWEIVIELPSGEHRDAFEAAIEVFATGCAVFEIEDTPRWRITGYTEGEPDRATVIANVAVAAAATGTTAPEVAIVPVASKDWVAEVEKTLTPIHVGPYYVFGSHVRDTPPEDCIAIQIDAGLAFGTGNHETTQGCLQAFEAFFPDSGPSNPIDVGTGSGILAIALAKRYGVGVVASDIDPVAIDVAEQNAVINGVADRLSFAVSGGLEAPAIEAGAPYDLIVANIVANPLIALAPGISGIAAKGARVVLSGILHDQAATVAGAYAAEGLMEAGRIERGNWTTLILNAPV